MILLTQPKRNRQHGHTLVETMVAVSLASMLFGGIMSVYITMLRLAGSVNSSTKAAIDAGNVIQRVTNDIREARTFQLMDGGSFGSTYDAVVNGNVVAVTGVQITFPAMRTTASVYTTAGTTSVPLNGTSSLWNRQVDGTTLSFYRANPDGTANPTSGTCLWASGVEGGASINQAIVSSISPAATAVQFIQPTLADGVTPITNEIKVKIACSYADPIHGSSSNESNVSNVTNLTGECVYLRDHNPNGTASSGIHGRTQN